MGCHDVKYCSTFLIMKTCGIHQVGGEEWVQVLLARGVQSQGPQDVRSDHGEYQVSGCRDFWPIWIIEEKSADQMIGKILTSNFYHRTRRRGTNCPPDHRMENTPAKGLAPRGQMWSDCFVFKSAANQCGHIEFLFLKSSRRKRGQNAFWIQFFLNKSVAKLKEFINSPAKASASFLMRRISWLFY